MKFPRLAHWLAWRVSHPQRKPDFVVRARDGSVYLRRWWLIPRNRWCNLYLHQFLASDDERALHDHMYFSASLMLWGAYIEHTIRGL